MPDRAIAKPRLRFSAQVASISPSPGSRGPGASAGQVQRYRGRSAPGGTDALHAVRPTPGPVHEVVGMRHLKSDITLSVGVNSVVGGPGRPAPAGHVAGAGGEASDGLERPSQEELDLGRRAAKLVGGPAS